ncbi:hypothetical protein SAMN04488063_2450 [Halopelagius inordinatus]|uniref:Uncharacterized protein n=1 Tax=Halopelagius inordinatus TaxID=553467 RepID=A0A1I2SWK1_9EURY|nr:hypothetical protein [Halopelagius inordinatus]SFG56993.1 hypothetical protein SAMN04488063_2450 [Halopelagius inordinatus]
MSQRPPAGPTRYDYQLGAMGMSLASGGVVGLLSSIPLYVAGSLGALVAAVVVVVGTATELA